jgi:hypothetical protein
MKRVTLILAGLMCFPMVGSSSAEWGGVTESTQRGTGPAIDWHSIDGGGTMFSTGGGMTLGGTIGQADAGPGVPGMTGGTLSLTGGFWVVAASSAPGCATACGDMNGSGGNVDLVDFAIFSTCFGLVGPNPSCDAGEFICSDLNEDGVINLLDFATFLLTFGVSSTNVLPNCP